MKRLLCGLMILGSFASAADLDVHIDGPDSKGVFAVRGDLEVAASTSIVWGTLTDYDRMAEFLYPSVTNSEIKEQEDNRLYVNQTFVARVLFFSHSADVLFEVILSPELNTITFQDILHEDFEFFNGCWSFYPTKNGTMLSYSVRLIPKGGGPNFIIRSTSRKMAVAVLSQLKEEIEKRGRT